MPSTDEPRRVAEMEQKLDSLYALLSSTAESQSTTNSSQSPSVPASASAPPAVELNDPLDDSTLFQYDMMQSFQPPFTNADVSEAAFPTFSLTYIDEFQDVISRGLVDFEQAEGYIRMARDKVATFPFVVIPPDVTLDDLRRQRPFLLLTILACSAVDSLKLQDALDEEIRETLSKRAMLKGEKSLDLIQGLLVYLSW